MKNLISIIFIFLFTWNFSQCPIIPSPTSYKETKGEYFLNSNLSASGDSLPSNLSSQLTSILKSNFDVDIFFSDYKKPIFFFFQTNTNSEKNAYSIKVKDGLITVNFTSEASCFYAINSLLQLIYQKEGKYYIKNCEISDAPKFEWRGLHLDVSRHFYTVDEVKRFIDLMAFYKFNTFHWHLTDDQGWRIEIKQFPKLTEIGAWRDSTVNKHYTTTPRTYTVEKYGGFYTQEQIKDVVKYAQERYVTIVPEIEMPGHARAALAAYPEYSCTGELQGVPGLWGVFDDIYCAKKESIAFNKAILDEVLELFPSKYIHVGGDEAPKERWKKCPNCQNVMAENHLKDEHELQSYFIRQMDVYLTSKGRKLIGWDEILEGGLSPNASVMSWRGTEGGIEAVKQGHSVVMSPGSHCYFDHYQSRNPNEPIAFGGFTPLEKVYEFNPVPKELNETEAKLILGGQANLWTEYIPDMKQLEYMTYPRALALAEVLWSGEKRPKFEVFQQKLIDYHIILLQKRNVNFSKAIFYPILKNYIYKKKFILDFECVSLSNLFNIKVEGPIQMEGDSVGKSKIEIDLLSQEKKGNLVIKISPLINGEEAPEIVYSYFLHDALGQEIKFVTPPNKKYNFNQELALVDGVRGRIPWNSSQWLGFDTSTIVLEMNLGEVKKVNSLEIGFLNDVSSWIHLPQKIEILTSTDNKIWKTTSFENIRSLALLNLNQEAKFIRFKIYSLTKIPDGNPGAGYTPWTFMDEIIMNLD